MPYLDPFQSQSFNLAGQTFSFDIVELISYGIIAFILLGVVRIFSILFRLLINKRIAKGSKRFPRTYKPTDLRNPKRILIAGDSTAVGTGATRAEETFGGRLAHDFPNAEIIIAAQNGARSNAVLKQLQPYANEKFDMVLISTGGNDMFYVGNLTHTITKLGEALNLARTISNNRTILLLYSTNVGVLFPLPLQKLINYNRNRVQRALRGLAVSKQVPCIELFTNEYSYDNPFYAENYHKLLASDHIHPNSEGYRVWYLRLWRSMAEEGYELTPKPARPARPSAHL